MAAGVEHIDEEAAPFEQVKAQMPMLWKQRQESKVFEQLMKEATQRYQITYADAYKPAQQ